MGRAESKKIKDSNRMNQHIEQRRQRKLALSYILNNAYQDSLIGEIVSRTDRDEVLTFLKFTVSTEYGVWNGVVPGIEKGLVLSDPLGRGVFQPKNPEIKQARAVCRDYPKHNYGINPNVHQSKMLNPFGNVIR